MALAIMFPALIDHKTRYIWIYPMKLKSNVFMIFTQFKTLVENFFQCQIKSVYSDGGEYNTLKPLFNKLGIYSTSSDTSLHS